MTDDSDTSQSTNSDDGNTPDYKAMYEAANAEKDKISGQYKSLQSKHNKTAKVDKNEYSDMGAKMEAMQVTIDSLKNINETADKNTLLGQLTLVDKKLAESHNDSDVSTLKTVVATALALKKGEFPSHTKPTEKDGKKSNEVKTGSKNWDFANNKWIKE